METFLAEEVHAYANPCIRRATWSCQ